MYTSTHNCSAVLPFALTHVLSLSRAQLEEMKQMQGGLASMLNPDAGKPKAIEKPATGAEKRSKKSTS